MRIIFASLIGLLCCMAGPASAREGGEFKILKLEGNHVRWLVPRNDEPVVVTYRLASGPVEFAGARNCRKMTHMDELIAASGIDTAAMRNELAVAFTLWEEAANITFREAAEGKRADIVIGAQMEPEGWAFADVFYDTVSPAPIKPISRALVCLNPLRRWKIGFDGDLKRYDLRYTFAHEIGHAIGLDHPSGGDEIMGYRYEERFRTLQAGDVRGAVALYGQARHAGLPHPPQLSPGEAPRAHPFALRRFAKRWGTRGFDARSP